MERFIRYRLYKDLIWHTMRKCGIGRAFQGAGAGAPFGVPGMAAGGLAGLLSGLFGNGSKDPMKEANKYYDQIPGMMKPYYDPYVQAGQHQIPGLVMMNILISAKDPGSIIARLAGGYQKSPGYNFQLGEGERAIGNAAAAGGMAGTAQHQQQAGTMANNLANQDFQQYLQQAMGLYGRGLGGKEGLMDQGYKAGSSLSENLAQLLGRKGDLAYKERAFLDKQKNNNGMWNNIFGGLGSIFG